MNNTATATAKETVRRPAPTEQKGMKLYETVS